MNFMKNRQELLKIINSMISRMDGNIDMIEEKMELERMAEEITVLIQTEQHDQFLKEVMQSELPMWMYKMYN